MKLWQRASGVLKDRNSIWLATFKRRTTLRNPDIEAAVIKCTSHDDSTVDYRNAQRVFAWVRVSPSYVKPLVWAISMRLEKTRSWVVALKGLMLLHGVFCCKVPSIQQIGRLPFDLSGFTDGHSKPDETWGHNQFIRAYYTFLDQKSSFIYLHAQEQRKGQLLLKDYEDGNSPLMQDLIWLQNMQGLLDMLLQIKPESKFILGVLILEAMDCIVIEIFDVYSRICSAIAKVLTRIYSAGKVEASMALKILQKATAQSEELSKFFEFCREIGVLNAEDCPAVKQIPEEDILELEQIINDVSDNIDLAPEKDKELTIMRSESQIIVHEQQQESINNKLQTIITNNWEVFDEDYQTNPGIVCKPKEETLLPLIDLPDLHAQPNNNNKDLPDLISF